MTALQPLLSQPQRSPHGHRLVPRRRRGSSDLSRRRGLFVQRATGVILMARGFQLLDVS